MGAPSDGGINVADGSPGAPASNSVFDTTVSFRHQLDMQSASELHLADGQIKNSAVPAKRTGCGSWRAALGEAVRRKRSRGVEFCSTANPHRVSM